MRTTVPRRAVIVSPGDHAFSLAACFACGMFLIDIGIKEDTLDRSGKGLLFSIAFMTALNL